MTVSGVSVERSPATATDGSDGYYGRPIVRPHVWKDAIGWYFFTGGLAGASSVVAAAAELAGDRRLASHARRASMLGLLPSPALLIVDLGRPSRFYNMLRVFKPNSPMSVGSWLLAAYSPLAGGSWLLGEVSRLPRLRRLLGLGAGALGPAIATYTAVLVADTATPVWFEARRELPFVFAGSAAASAGAASNALAALDGVSSATAGRIAAAGAVAEIGAATVMKRRLGDLDTYSTSPSARRLSHLATALSLGGALVGLLAGKRRALAVAGSVSVLVGSICERMAVVRAGTASATDPRSVLTQQKDAHTDA